MRIKYNNAGHPGASICVQGVGPEQPPCPPPGYDAKAPWLSKVHLVQGPVWLLLQSLHEHKAVVDADFVIRTWPVRKVDLRFNPIQGLKAAVADIAADCHF